MEYHDGIIGDESPPVPDETAPAAPVVEEPPVVAEPETPDAPVESAPTPPDKPDPVQQRINQLTAARRQAENEAAYWRGQAEAKTPPPQTPTTPAPPEGEPQEADFETFPAYAAALHRYHAKQATAAERAAVQEQATAVALQVQQAADQAEIQKSSKAWKAREAEVITQHPDYMERLTTVGAQIGDHVRWGIGFLGADVPDMILYLHDHPEAIQQLNEMPAHRLGIEFGRILRQTGSTPGSTPARSAPPPTPKPEPPTPLPGGGRTSSPDTYREGMSPAEYRTMRQRTSTLPYIRRS